MQVFFINYFKMSLNCKVFVVTYNYTLLKDLEYHLYSIREYPDYHHVVIILLVLFIIVFI